MFWKNEGGNQDMLRKMQIISLRKVAHTANVPHNLFSCIVFSFSSAPYEGL